MNQVKYKRGKHPNSRPNNRKYEVNNNYFSELTEENCYYAGFIAGDGCITKRGDLVISVQHRDMYILYNFIKTLNSNYPVRKNKNNEVISIRSHKINEDLMNNFNITQKKSLTLYPPKLNNNIFIDSYIKGIIDADGCIGLSKKYGLDISFVGTKELCQFLINRFSEILKRKILITPHKPKANCYTIKISDKMAREIFLHYYKIPYGLKRKWSEEKYNYCINWKSKRVNTEKCIKIFNLLKNYSIKEIAEMYGCTYANIHIFIKSKVYQDFLISNGNIDSVETE